MNQFHHPSIDTAFARLAVSTQGSTISATIGGHPKQWDLNSPVAAKAALERIHAQTFVSFASIAAACGAHDHQSAIAEHQPTPTSA